MATSIVLPPPIATTASAARDARPLRRGPPPPRCWPRRARAPGTRRGSAVARSARERRRERRAADHAQPFEAELRRSPHRAAAPAPRARAPRAGNAAAPCSGARPRPSADAADRALTHASAPRRAPARGRRGRRSRSRRARPPARVCTGTSRGQLLERVLVVDVERSRAARNPPASAASSSPCAGSIRVSPMYSGCGPTGASLLRSREPPVDRHRLHRLLVDAMVGRAQHRRSLRRHEPPRDLVLEQHVGVHDVAAAAHDVARAPQRVHVAVLRVASVEALARDRGRRRRRRRSRAVAGDGDHVPHTGRGAGSRARARASGTPPTSSIAFGRSSVSGRRRVPSPAAR